MTIRAIIKIIFLALIAGNLMGVVLIQILGEMTVLTLIQLEISLIVIIVLLFVSSTLWNKRLQNKKNSTEATPESKEEEGKKGNRDN